MVSIPPSSSTTICFKSQYYLFSYFSSRSIVLSRAQEHFKNQQKHTSAWSVTATNDRSMIPSLRALPIEVSLLPVSTTTRSAVLCGSRARSASILRYAVVITKHTRESACAATTSQRRCAPYEIQGNSGVRRERRGGRDGGVEEPSSAATPGGREVPPPSPLPRHRRRRTEELSSVVFIPTERPIAAVGGTEHRVEPLRFQRVVVESAWRGSVRVSRWGASLGCASAPRETATERGLGRHSNSTRHP